jgi:hypothetical protein
MAVHKSRRSILFTKENVDSRKARKWLDLNHPSCFLQDLTYTLRTCCDDDIEIEIAYEECRASIDERALTTHPRCHGGDVQLQLQSLLAEFASPLHWMECRRPLSRIDPAYSCLP